MTFCSHSKLSEHLHWKHTRIHIYRKCKPCNIRSLILSPEVLQNVAGRMLTVGDNSQLGRYAAEKLIIAYGPQQKKKDIHIRLVACRLSNTASASPFFLSHVIPGMPRSDDSGGSSSAVATSALQSLNSAPTAPAMPTTPTALATLTTLTTLTSLATLTTLTALTTLAAPTAMMWTFSVRLLSMIFKCIFTFKCALSFNCSFFTDHADPCSRMMGSSIFS